MSSLVRSWKIQSLYNYPVYALCFYSRLLFFSGYSSITHLFHVYHEAVEAHPTMAAEGSRADPAQLPACCTYSHP